MKASFFKNGWVSTVLSFIFSHLNPSPLEPVGIPSLSFQQEQSLFSRTIPWQGQTLNSEPRIDVGIWEGTEAMFVVIQSYTYISCLRGTLHMVFALCSQSVSPTENSLNGANVSVCHCCESGLQTTRSCTCSWPRKLRDLKMLGRCASCHPHPNGRAAHSQ